MLETQLPPQLNHASRLDWTGYQRLDLPECTWNYCARGCSWTHPHSGECFTLRYLERAAGIFERFNREFITFIKGTYCEVHPVGWRHQHFLRLMRHCYQAAVGAEDFEIGRASCREGGWRWEGQ